MANKVTNNLGRDSIGKLLFRLAVPSITAQVVNMLYNIVDRIYICHIPDIGATALTGVGVTFPIIMIIAAFSSLIGMGGGPRASICMGQGKYDEAERILGNCFITLLGISVVLTAFFLLAAEPLLFLFGASADTLPYGLSYMNIYVSGTIFVQMALGLNSFITIQGKAKTSMLTVVIGAVTNIALSSVYLCIRYGRPRRGHCHHYLPGPFVGMGALVFARQAHKAQDQTQVSASQTDGYRTGIGLGRLPLCHAEHREPCEHRPQLLPPVVRRRYRRGSHDHIIEPYAGLYPPPYRVDPRRPANYQL